MAAPEMAFLEMTLGSQSLRLIDDDLRLVPTGGTQTTLVPGPKLISRIERFGITFRDIAPSHDQEPIVVRAAKKPRQQTAHLVEFMDTRGMGDVSLERPRPAFGVWFGSSSLGP